MDSRWMREERADWFLAVYPVKSQWKEFLLDVPGGIWRRLKEPAALMRTTEKWTKDKGRLAPRGLSRAG